MGEEGLQAPGRSPLPEQVEDVESPLETPTHFQVTLGKARPPGCLRQDGAAKSMHDAD